MSKKPQSDMKQAFKQLKVNLPYSLSKSGPALAPPQPKNEVPHLGAPLPDLGRKDEPLNREPQNMDAQRKAAHSEPPDIEAPQNQSPNSGVTQVEEPRLEVPQVEIARNRNAQKEVPEMKAPQFETPIPQGFFKLSHGVFAHPLLRDISGDCFRLFLCLSSRAWRYPDSNGLVRASVSFIEDLTGMSHSNISRGLKTLKELNLITLHETDFKNGNTWLISPIAIGHPGPGGGSRIEEPQKEVPQYSGEAPSFRGSRSLKMKEEPPQKGADLRSINKTKTLKKCGEPIENKSNALVSQDENSEYRSEALSAFATLVENQQRQMVSDFVIREFPHGYLPPDRVVRSMVALNWFRASRMVEAVRPQLATA